MGKTFKSFVLQNHKADDLETLYVTFGNCGPTKFVQTMTLHSYVARSALVFMLSYGNSDTVELLETNLVYDAIIIAHENIRVTKVKVIL